MEHLEGRQSILAALQARQRRFQVLLIAQGTHEEKLVELLATAEAMGVPIRRVDRKELDTLAHGGSHGGAVAICSAKPRLNGDQLIELVDSISGPPLLLLLEGVDDARNLGFTLRSADALGVHAVMIKKHLWDFDPTEIARPASGAYERLPLAQIDNVEPLVALQRKGMRLVGCIAGAKRTMYDVKLSRPTILAIGGEKRGLSGAVRSICDRFITIPTVGSEASSLSLSHAGAIVMAEAMRQRRMTGPATKVRPHDADAAERSPADVRE
jgi:23S rRNA (guanosine2251-2'-O)-methyltransferase